MTSSRALRLDLCPHPRRTRSPASVAVRPSSRQPAQTLAPHPRLDPPTGRQARGCQHADADIVLAVDSESRSSGPVRSPALFSRGEHTGLSRSPRCTRTCLTISFGTHRPTVVRPAPDGPSVLTITSRRWSRSTLASYATRDQIESTQGRVVGAMTSNLRFSEYILYGTYVDEIAPPDAGSFASERACVAAVGDPTHSGPRTSPFVASLREDDVAVHVQSTSHADHELRQAVVRGARDRFRL